MSLAQIPLNVQLSDDATFDNFFPGSNRALLHYLSSFLEQKNWQDGYIWGPAYSGRSHLLQACCHQLNQQNLETFYLPLSARLKPQILENLENLALLCIDDLETIVGNRAWEEALFHLYNRLRANGGKLLITATAAPANLACSLPDLKSRLSASTVFQVKSLTDEDKIKALQLRAHVRGLDLSNEVAQFLLNHYARDMVALFNTLSVLDHASLAAQRKLTIPFVKQVLKG